MVNTLYFIVYHSIRNDNCVLTFTKLTPKQATQPQPPSGATFFFCCVIVVVFFVFGIPKNWDRWSFFGFCQFTSAKWGFLGTNLAKFIIVIVFFVRGKISKIFIACFCGMQWKDLFIFWLTLRTLKAAFADDDDHDDVNNLDPIYLNGCCKFRGNFPLMFFFLIIFLQNFFTCN